MSGFDFRPRHMNESWADYQKAQHLEHVRQLMEDFPGEINTVERRAILGILAILETMLERQCKT